jgi:hypothetical protein
MPTAVVTTLTTSATMPTPTRMILLQYSAS